MVKWGKRSGTKINQTSGEALLFLIFILFIIIIIYWWIIDFLSHMQWLQQQFMIVFFCGKKMTDQLEIEMVMRLPNVWIFIVANELIDLMLE